MQTTLLNFLQTNAQQQFNATLTTKTLVKLNKNNATKTAKNNLGNIYKVQTLLVSINEDYALAVQQQQAIEGKPIDFVAAKLPWGVHICKSVIEHNAQHYLQCIVVAKTAKTKYYNEDGQEVKYEDFAQFVSSSTSSNSKQNVENTINVRTFAFKNILELIVKTPNLVVVLKA